MSERSRSMKRPVIGPVAVILVLAFVLGSGAISRADSNVAQLWDLEAIKKVQYAYAYNIDNGTLDNLMAVFAEDASAEYSFPGGDFTLKSKKEIRDFLGPHVGTGGVHLMINPYIEVSGSKASGVFYLLRIQPPPKPCPENADVGWIIGWYNCVFEKAQGTWRIKRLKFSAEGTGTISGCKFKGAWGIQFPPPLNLE